MPPASETPRLIVDPEFLNPDQAAVFSFGINGLRVGDIVHSRRQLVDDARAVGIVVVEAERLASQLGPNDYVARGVHSSRQEIDAHLQDQLPEVRIPITRTFEQFSAAPFFPALAKHQSGWGGRDKYPLERPEQWEKLSRLLTGGKPLRPLRDEVDYTPDQARSYQNPLGSRSFTHLFDYQEIIDTPGDRYTSYRVLVSANGTILASSLYYSSWTKDTAPLLTTPGPVSELDGFRHSFTRFLTTSGSLVYLDAKNITSNEAQGARGIVLDPLPSSQPLNNTDREVLEAHGIDPSDPSLPEDIAEPSQNIGRLLHPYFGVVAGLDWVPQAPTNTPYYLETNASPGTKAFVDRYYGLPGMTLPRSKAEHALNRMALESLVA